MSFTIDLYRCKPSGVKNEVERVLKHQRTNPLYDPYHVTCTIVEPASYGGCEVLKSEEAIYDWMYIYLMDNQ